MLNFGKQRQQRDMNFACDITDKVLQEIIDTIVREVDPERIILFGSRARGKEAGK
jgi:predicted nucleotidyltransferase